ncbi:hypothetical protein HBB16_00080 [Pseudonocardia sp. MCCB 268]|nr:hypothetical protein [Pseudonocardia cytotoxica]
MRELDDVAAVATIRAPGRAPGRGRRRVPALVDRQPRPTSCASASCSAPAVFLTLSHQLNRSCGVPARRRHCAIDASQAPDAGSPGDLENDLRDHGYRRADGRHVLRGA